MDQMDTRANQSSQYYYELNDNGEVDEGCNCVDEDGEDDAQASKIQAATWWIPFGGEFPLEILSGGEASWFLFISVTLI
jgi:hypothetical protein